MAALPAQQRYVQRKDGSYVDTQTGQVFPAAGGPPPALKPSPTAAIVSPVAALANALQTKVPNSATHAPDVMGALGSVAGSIPLGDPAAMRASIQSNMGPSTAKYDTTGAPDLLNAFSRTPGAGADDVMNREGGGALPAATPSSIIPSFLRRTPTPGNDNIADREGAPAALPPAPLAASGGADSTSDLAGAFPMPKKGGAATDPAVAQAMEEATKQKPVISDSGPDLLSAGENALVNKAKNKNASAPDNVQITPGAWDSSGHQFGNMSDVPPPAAGALPDVTKGLDLTKQITAQNSGLPDRVGHETSTLEKIGGALGLRDGDTSYAGEGAFDGLMGDPDRRQLLEMGLATMASAGKPGGTLGGALGEGGMYALQARDVRQDRADRDKFEQKKLDTENKHWDAETAIKKLFHGDEQANENRNYALKSAEYMSGVQDKTALRGIEQQKADADTTRAAAASKNEDRANALKASELAISQGRLDEDTRKNHDENYDKAFNQFLGSHKSGTNSSIDALLNPQDSAKLQSDAEAYASQTAPESTQAKSYGSKLVAKLQDAVDAANAKGDKAEAARNQTDMVKAIKMFFPNAKPPGAK